MTASTPSIALGALRAHPHWYIFPIKRHAKYPPCFENNLELASNDPEQVRKWHALHVGCNWGLSLGKSRTIVIDVDTKPGKVGRDTLETLELINGNLPATYTVRTPSGGFHYYFNEANGVQHKLALGEHGFGRDIDSTNYVLLAGCELKDGGSYDVFDRAPIAPSPAWFAFYLRPTNTPDADQDIPAAELDTDANVEWAKYYLVHDAPPAIQGRNGEHTLLLVAACLKDHGISEYTSVQLLAEFFNSRCEPPWDIGEGPTADRLDVKVHNAWLYLKQTRPGAYTAAAEFADVQEDDTELAALAARWKAFDASPREVRKREKRAAWERARRLVTIPDKDRQPQR